MYLLIDFTNTQYFTFVKHAYTRGVYLFLDEIGVRAELPKHIRKVFVFVFNEGPKFYWKKFLLTN